jgi:phosphoglycolate phosphatase-like HAD superfamily hydrolase
MQKPETQSIERVYLRPGFAWDMQDAYLFDIDGTLLRDPDRIHHDSFAISVQAVTGLDLSLDGISVHGSTDTAILRDAWLQANLPIEALEQQLPEILHAMGQNVAERRLDMRLVRMPGVEDVLRHLAARSALLGVATGNLETIGWIKIEQAGLRQWFTFGGFSDHFPSRPDLIANAALKARKLAGNSATVCIVGDTPRDITAARANNLPVIAVATGHFTFDQLLELHPDACATSLAHLLAATQVSA